MSIRDYLAENEVTTLVEPASLLVPPSNHPDRYPSENKNKSKYVANFRVGRHMKIRNDRIFRRVVSRSGIISNENRLHLFTFTALYKKKENLSICHRFETAYEHIFIRVRKRTLFYYPFDNSRDSVVHRCNKK